MTRDEFRAAMLAPPLLDFGKFEIEHDFAKQYTNVHYAAGPTIQVTDQLLAQTNEGAFMRAFKQEMEAAMSDYKATTTNSYYIDPPCTQAAPHDPVKEAKQQLKRAQRADKLARKQAKAARRAERQRQADRELLMSTLRGIVADPHNTPAERQHAGDRLIELS